ncbi:hypothetical protein IQ06DRAFT_304503 [Phaeosphaeriaceae sp. SRC1lsM3a]|nr:hypothetical protein IQ06DRAFT_304503 [Stagonospora sp. SRC1lsM3a]
MLVTLLDCFEQEHPSYHIDSPPTWYVSSSSATTKNQVPPKVLVRQDIQDWLHLADQFLQSQEAQHSDLARESEPSKAPMDLNNEAAVRTLADNHIVMPVLKALLVKHPHKLKYRPEETTNPLRVDAAICVAGANPKKKVVLLEYKRCPYITSDNFEDALHSEDQIEDKLERLRVAKKTCTLDEDLDDYIFLKQATAYYIQTGCPYVALCDYESLILIRFLGGGQLESAKVTVVPRNCFRKALLGFSLEACQDI